MNYYPRILMSCKTVSPTTLRNNIGSLFYLVFLLESISIILAQIFSTVFSFWKGVILLDIISITIYGVRFSYRYTY
jgi:hypothetical protein